MINVTNAEARNASSQVWNVYVQIYRDKKIVATGMDWVD